MTASSIFGNMGTWRQNFGHTAGAARCGRGATRRERPRAAERTPGPALVAGQPATEASGPLLQPDGSGPAVPIVPLARGLLGLGRLRRVAGAAGRPSLGNSSPRRALARSGQPGPTGVPAAP